MGNRKDRKLASIAPKEQVIFEPQHGRIRYKEMILTVDTIRAFFGLAALQRIVRFHISPGKAVVVERVPEGVESFYSEVSRLLEKYSHDSAAGFKEILRTTKFAERIGIS